jgi:hypothetical protein
VLTGLASGEFPPKTFFRLSFHETFGRNIGVFPGYEIFRGTVAFSVVIGRREAAVERAGTLRCLWSAKKALKNDEFTEDPRAEEA